MMISNYKGIVHLTKMLLFLNLILNNYNLLIHICKLEYVLTRAYFQVTLKRRSGAIKKKKEIFKRAEQYVKEYRIRERDEIRLVRQVRHNISLLE